MVQKWDQMCIYVAEHVIKAGRLIEIMVQLFYEKH
jgi:hypothetical protein